MRSKLIILFICLFTNTVFAFQNKVIVTKVGQLPKYPAIFRAAKIESEVILEVSFSPDGSMRSVQNKKCLSFFCNVVDESIKDWIFTCVGCNSEKETKHLIKFHFIVDYCIKDEIVHYNLKLPDQVTISIRPAILTCSDCNNTTFEKEQLKEWDYKCKASKSDKDPQRK